MLIAFLVLTVGVSVFLGLVYGSLNYIINSCKK